MPEKVIFGWSDLNMRKNSLLDKYLLAKPTIRMVIEWPILICVGIIGTVFSLQTIPFSPISNIFGILILVIGLGIHASSHWICIFMGNCVDSNPGYYFSYTYNINGN